MLKLDVNKDSPRGVSLSTQNKVIPDDCEPNKNESSQPLNNAGIVSGNEKFNNQQAMQMKKKRPNKKHRAKQHKQQKSQMSLDNGAARNREMRSKYQNNAGKVTDCGKSESTNNIISSCSDGNNSGANETGRHEREAEAILTGPLAVKQNEKKPTTVRSGIPRKRCVPLKTKTKI